ncbi:endonuclease domain-containing 1 protein-like [Salvelinus sp. IW2-2015]|uniref:endonuclease domain-containing 1 protein-like n=1 Tax=Salvelinus sp. IW2-2015 TaxID=2691554 RepID=UPI0038D3FCE5
MMGVLNHLSTLLLLSLLPHALSHVVNKFSDVPQCKDFFLGGTTPNLPGILVGGEVQNQDQNEGRYKPICQKFQYKKKNNKFYKTYMFATLYDTFNKIPVFSAYTFTSPPTATRPNQTWMIEPQLEDEMNVEVNNTNVKHQAADTDYLNNNLGLDRGHLFPCSFAPDDAAKMYTFTLTNIVPQHHTFNNGSWNDMELNIRKTLEGNCKINNKIKAYLVTGAVPSNNNNNQLNNRVNIPSHLWTAFCCYNNLGQWIAEAYWAENVAEEKSEKKTVTPITLNELELKLESAYELSDVKVFPKGCLTNEDEKNRESVEQADKGEGIGELRNKKQREEHEDGEKNRG